MSGQQILMASSRNNLPNPKPMPHTPAQLPIAYGVPGKLGLVYSPFAKGKIVAVAGGVMAMPNKKVESKYGEVVVCPYSGKQFRVR